MSSGKFLVRQHKDDNRTNPVVSCIEIDGSALTTTTANAGVIRGVEIAQAKDDGANIVTVTFRTPFRNSNYTVHITPVATADALAVTITRAAGTLTYTTVKASDASTAVNDADVMILIVSNDDGTII